MRLLILIITLNTSLIAQTPLFNPVDLSKNYFFNTVAQDHYGFLWIGGTEGLVFYNGIEDRLIAENQINSPVYSMAVDTLTLFAGSDSGTIFCVDLKTRTLRDSIQLDISAKISDLDIIDNRLYISTYGEGLFFWSPDSSTITKVEQDYSSRYIYECLYTSSGDLFIATDRGLDILSLKTNSLTHVDGLPDIIVTNLALKEDTLIWASTYDKGIFSIGLNDLNVTFFPFAERQKINDLIIHNDKIILSTSHAVYYLIENSKKYIQVSDMPTQEFHALFIDQENNLWLLNKHNPVWKASMYFEMIDSLDIRDIQALEYFNDLLIIGNQKGLYAMHTEVLNYQKILNNNITSISKTENLLVVGTYSGGILILDQSLNQVLSITTKDGLPNNSVLDVEAVDNGIIASTLAGVVKIYFNNNQSSGLLKIEPLHPNTDYSYVMDIYATPESVYLGKDKAGFSVVRKDTLLTLKQYNDTNQKLGSVNSIAQAEDGSIWVSASDLGLLKLEDDTLRIINSIHYGDESYSSIIPLPNNNLLLVRSSSIDLFDVSREHIMYFDQEAQLYKSEPFINNFAFGEDKVWFVHHDKIYTFTPPSDNQKIHPTTSIDQIEVNLEYVPKTKNIFAQSQNNFKFNFTGGWLTDPGKLSYAYYLEGFDAAWRETKDRSVSYPHLPPGKYSFHVKAAENKYFSDEPVNSYSFRIKRSFYNSDWFYILLIGLAALIIYYFIKRRQSEKDLRAKLKQKQVEAQLINLKAQLNPHFLFNSFNTLSGLIEEAPEKSITYIENITDFYRYILELGDRKLIPLSKELELVALYEKLLRERFGNGFEIDVQVTDQSLPIPPMTLQMLIENAIKHNQLSTRQPLKIQIIQKGDKLIVNNSKLLKNSSVPGTGLGIKNISDRYRLLGFEEVLIKENHSTFSVLLPIQKRNKDEGNNS